MALGTHNMKPTRADDLLMQFLPLLAHFSHARLLVLIGEIGIIVDLVDLRLGISAQYYVGPATRHVGRDGNHFRPASLGNDVCLTRVLFGVQHLMWKLLFLQQFREEFGILN